MLCGGKTLNFDAVNVYSTNLAMAAALRNPGWEERGGGSSCHTLPYRVGQAPATESSLCQSMASSIAMVTVISMVMVAVGVYARLMKHAEAALACLAVDPAILLIVVGVLMFLLTFCGCIGSLRENICLLQTFSLCLTIVFLLQLAAGILGFVFSDKARGKVSELINNAIVHYRDDLDLQNLIDFGQKKFSCCGGISYRDWSQNMYFNCSEDNPSRERCSVPYSCCLPTPNQAVINTMCGQNMQALDYLEASKVIYTNGCIDKLVNWIHSNLFLLGGVALGLAIPQLVGILLSQVLVNQIKDQIKLQLYNQQHRADPWFTTVCRHVLWKSSQCSESLSISPAPFVLLTVEPFLHTSPLLGVLIKEL
ncbi:tetraspanin-33-like protein [Cricetulus griseus]|uniref:Tetraspanin-33 n=1 Tax=Cricetulus griseus TaxID=10029 RepID=A0A061IKS5_CRIGR|nr:tetraspanin-33-like protein [Cricetulus griseus]